jgi:hypothetical protein
VVGFCEHSNETEMSGSHGSEYEDDRPRDISPCRLVEVDRHSRGAYCVHRQACAR